MKRRGRPPYPDLLTPREQEVLALLREGLSNDQIAQRLGVSLAGAKYHVSEILGKLGVSSREEAARWSAPGGRPWWLSSFAPLDALRHRLGWAPRLALGAMAVGLVASVALLIWGLMRTNSDEAPASTSDRRTVVAPTATFDFSSLPPLPTGEPYAAAPVDCPGGFDTPEDAIGACLEIQRSYTTYTGDCDTPQPIPTSTGIFDQPCSSWADGLGSPRAYAIHNLGADGFDWAIVEQQTSGWRATMWSLCGVQGSLDYESELIARGGDLSVARPDDCRFAPLPLVRPSVRVGPTTETVMNNGRTSLSVTRGILYPNRGIKLPVLVRNISGGTLPWIADAPSAIQLVSENGTTIPASEVGGTLARTIAEGMPIDGYWTGWIVFPVEDLGRYTLRYPGQPDLELRLEPLDCLRECGPSKTQ